MITKLEIDGFKTFRNFQVELAPFQVIIGPNGAGKSNLFDAIHLLARLADDDLRTAFQELRGDAGEIFSLLPDGDPVDRMRLAAEILVDKSVQDSWGAQATIKYTRMRYELNIARRADGQGLDRLYVDHESLTAIPRGEDAWTKRYDLTARNGWLPTQTGGRPPFISTTMGENDNPTISLHQDLHGGRKSSVAAKVERTLLSGALNTEFPHAFAAREEMRAWRFLQLNPEELRKPSSMVGPQAMAADGRYLAATLARLQANDPTILSDISLDLANLVPGLVRVEVERDEKRDQFVVWAWMEDGRRFSSRVLSDGTLRMLTLVTLKYDPEHRGVLCFEEPENGVHPYRLAKIAETLSDFATDFDDATQIDQPLRQFLCNTHSPVFISQPPILSSILFAFPVMRVDHAHPGGSERITRMVPVQEPSGQIGLEMPISVEERSYTIEEVKRFLNSADLGEARGLLAPNGYSVHPLEMER
ncbi:MAG: AAA family ATPase [Caldilineaceae bacterium]|nr:AAA family ATPase [Caldilineaceae bacterium]MBP8109996.1 AAA family ATPase [Caldilineaceae bacterium]MBP8122552.1 AAA family ATPase [Caldilineaceae bacterium]MBP9072864.1 AAA family ATPase [Caldilineaceae bacterium]